MNMAIAQPSLERLSQVLARTGLTRSALYRLIRSGEFPSPISIGGRAKAWDSAAISAWIVERIAAGSKKHEEAEVGGAQ